MSFFRPGVGYSTSFDRVVAFKAVFEKGPSAWFFEKNLYTVRAFGQQDDSIERHLFGSIDRDGQRGWKLSLTRTLTECTSSTRDSWSMSVPSGYAPREDFGSFNC